MSIKNKPTKLPSVEDMILELESLGLGWSLDHTGSLIEARVWKWPEVIGRYRPTKLMPLWEMMGHAMYAVDWEKYGPKKPIKPKRKKANE